MIQVWGLLFFWGSLSVCLGQEGQGAFLRVRKKYLEEEIAKHLANSSIGEQITNLVNARIKRPPHGAARSFFEYYLLIPPRMKVKTPYPPSLGIAKPDNDSLTISLRVVFGIYFESSFDALSDSVEIQAAKNFSVVLSSDGFRVKSCNSCKGFVIAQTLYKKSNISKADATPMVKAALRNNLAPVLDGHACDLLPSALLGPSGNLLNLKLFDLSPPGTQYSVKSTHLKEDALVFELRAPVGEGETEEDGEVETILDFLESLPTMDDKAIADIAMMKKQLDANFAQLLYPMKAVFIDKEHEMGYCVLENIAPLLPEEVSNEELDDYFVNITAREPPGFYTAYWGLYVNHPIKIEMFHTKEPGSPVWTRIDVYSFPADASVVDNKLRVSLTPNSGFLDMHNEHADDPSDLGRMLEKALDTESPLELLESLHQEFPLPMAPGIDGAMVETKIQQDEGYFLVSIIPK